MYCVRWNFYTWGKAGARNATRGDGIYFTRLLDIQGGVEPADTSKSQEIDPDVYNPLLISPFFVGGEIDWLSAYSARGDGSYQGPIAHRIVSDGNLVSARIVEKTR